jgi:O-antigen/teichoic acid export membrane protein
MTTSHFKGLLTKVSSSPIILETILFAVSTIALQGSRFTVNLSAARSLGPETWGLWYILNLVLAYGGLIHFGVINAMNREVPVSRGRGETDKVHFVQSVTFGVMTVSTLVAGGTLLFSSLAWNDDSLRNPLALLALLFVSAQLYIFLQIHLKSEGRFRRMSYQQLVFASLLPMLALPLTARYGLPGYILAQTVTTLVVAGFMIRKWPFNLKPVFNWREAFRLMKIGFPIMLVGLLYTLLTTADRWVIIAFFEAKWLGYYSLAIMTLGVTSLIPMVLAQQMYPRMAEAWGRTAQTRPVLLWALRQSATATVITLPVILVIYFTAPALVMRYLPTYQLGIPALSIILIAPLFLAISNGFANMLNTLDRQMFTVAVQVGAIMLNIGLNILFVRLGFGITGVAWATAATYAVYGLALVGLGFSTIRSMGPVNSR